MATARSWHRSTRRPTIRLLAIEVSTRETRYERHEAARQAHRWEGNAVRGMDGRRTRRDEGARQGAEDGRAIAGRLIAERRLRSADPGCL